MACSVTALLEINSLLTIFICQIQVEVYYYIKYLTIFVLVFYRCLYIQDYLYVRLTTPKYLRINYAYYPA
jgi:hypothetical protein